MSYLASDPVLKPVAKMQDDIHAFRLVIAMTQDLAPFLPTGLPDFIIGKARARDHEFFVVTFPQVAAASACGDLGEHQVFGRFTVSEESTVEALYLLGNFLAKYPFTGSKVYTDVYREDAARTAFHRANKWCRRMNALGQRAHGVANPLIIRARRIIASILPRFDWEQVVKRCYCGPGVNVGVGWDETDTQVKLFLQQTCTKPLSQQLNFAADLVPAQMIYEGIRAARGFDYPAHSDPGTWEVPIDRRFDFMISLGMDAFLKRVRVVRGSKYSAVPKNAKTFRSIAAEPMVNGFLQNGIGEHMRDILASYSEQMNCSDQNRNRVLAYAGSASGMLATIDLSSASDTVSAWLAKSLLPPDWYSAMRLVRSPSIDLGGDRAKLHMFSSMGNGFTFPLETLVFYAISRAAIELSSSTADCAPNEGGPGANQEPSVYGDDIIVTANDAPVVLRALRDCGFWPNQRKSFYSGPFRESCGHDYRFGRYVRPVFLKRPLEWTFDVISLINHLSNPAGFGWFSTRWSMSFSCLCRSLVDLSISFHPRIPLGPCVPEHVVTFVRVPTTVLKQWGCTTNSNVTDPECPDGRQTMTRGFKPLIIRPRKFRDIEDIASYMASLLKRPTTGAFSLYSRVKRGEVVVALPSAKTPASPIFGEDDAGVDALSRRYLAQLKRLAR